ncbi:hypothetical protein ACIO87_35935 [Streptomyces sp. NPDC087218]|uniref:hypothetical protein n=1 Tax=Streptomyces sp. NPDC087218 TaxID=3365769 RepID=UPI0037F26F6D
MRPSPRPALLASEILPQNLNLRDGERRTVKCPDCETWRPLKRSMISPHRVDDDPAPGPRRYNGDTTPRPRAGRCPGSAQLITMDITVEQWGHALLDAESIAASRRSARQHYKPLAEAQVPVSRMARAPKSQSAQYFQNELNTAHQRAREAVALHRSSCAACQAGRYCGTGRQLEERRTWTEETREEQRAKQARAQKADRRWERSRDEDQARRRKAQWAERGGKAVETANNRCAKRTPGARSDFRGPQVPMAPRDMEAHDRRQAELGKQYARRAATTV